MHKYVFVFSLLLYSFITNAQFPTIQQYNYLNSRALYINNTNKHTALKPIVYVNEKDTAITNNTSWGYRKLFKEHLLSVRTKEYNAFLDFLPDFQAGYEYPGKPTWLNTRGIQFEGNIGKNFYVYSAVYENQASNPTYLRQFIRTNNIVPGQGQPHNSLIKNSDYSNSTALIQYTPSKYINATIGYGKNFIGDGYRSMILSDVAFNYPYLKIIGTLGQVQYTSMWAQFMDLRSPQFSYDNGNRKKWGVFHYLDWNVNKKISIGLFESIIWQDADSTGKRGFDWSYINPIVLLRPVEFSNGSADNVLLGINIKYKIAPKLITYSQLLLDEFKLKEMISGKGWWANKYGIQLGCRAFDIFNVSKLDMQLEFNTARPYTYAQRSSLLNYAHYNEPLAHPLGANFREFLYIPSYQYKRWYIRGEVMFAQYGTDPVGENHGKNIFLSYNTRVNEYGNHIGQGIKTNLYLGDVKITYILNPLYNLRLEAGITYRKLSNSIENTTATWFTLGLRSSFRNIYYDL